MRCAEIRPYLPGFAGADLRADTTEVVSGHVEACKGCATEVARLRRVTSGLASLAVAEVEPPPLLLDSILESVHDRPARRVMPLIPVPPAELVRVVQDNRDAIASAAGTALVAAGAAYALWRAVRGQRRAQPAT